MFIDPNTNQPVKFDKETLSQGQFLNDIRKYMVAREGVDFETADPEEVIEKFYDIQRSVEAGNSVSLVKEGLFLRQADDDIRGTTARVYDMYKQSESIWESDDTFDGVTDWAQSILLDPVNLVGLGLGRLATSAVGATLGKQAVRRAAVEAAKKAQASGASRVAQKEAYEASMRGAATRAIAGRAGATAGYEGAIAGLSEYGTQSVRNEVKPEDKQQTDWAMVAAAAGLGAVAGGATFVFDVATKASRPQELTTAMRARPNQAAVQQTQQQAMQNILKQMSQFDWQTSVLAGKTKLGVQNTMDPDLFKDVLLGKQGGQGIHDYLIAAGVKPNPDGYSKTIVDFFNSIPAATKATFDKQFDTVTGGVYKTTDDFVNSFAATANTSGSLFNTISQSSKKYGTQLASKQAVANVLAGNPQLNQVATETFGLSYEKAFRNIWKRSLVSALGTTAVNIVGSGSYLIGQTAADALSGMLYLAKSPVSKGSLQKAAAQKSIIFDRFRYAFNSDLTREVFEQAIKINPSALEALQRTTNMGVAAPTDFLKEMGLEGASAFGKKVVMAGDAWANFAQKLTKVQAQDTFFKSLGFMDNMNREMYKKHGRSLEDIILSGDYKKLVTEDDFGRSVHNTLKMTFSADYTARNKMYNRTNQYTRALAQSVETISNSPLGYAIPFGRFMNNVVANTYQFSPVALAAELAPYMSQKGYKADTDVISKAILGTAAVTAAYELAEARRENGDPWHVIRYQGERYDLKNVYPMSYILAAGELAYRITHEEDYSDLMFLRDVGQQIAVGEIAAGLDFLDGSYAFVEALLDGNTTEIGKESGSAIGNILSGFTRPLTTVDLAVGTVKGDLRNPDYNQVGGDSGFFEKFGAASLQEAKRYTRRIFDAISGSDGMPDNKARKEAARPDVSREENPLGTQFGIREVPARTAAEKMFEQAGMQAWQAGQRSEHPEYTRLANEYIYPVLDMHARTLLPSKRWKNATEVERSNMVQGVMNRARQEVESMLEGSVKPEHMRWVAEKSVLSAKASRTTNNVFDEAIRRKGLIGEDIKSLSNKDLFELYHLINQIKENNKY